MSELKEINISDLKFNPWDKISKDWFLITSGDESGFNTMTASWGFMGEMWGKNIIETVIRHNRHTFEFMEKNDLFTVSFLSADRRDALKFCGAHSGRDCDKAKEASLTPVFLDGTTAFEEAELVFVCKKVYSADFDFEKISAEDKEKWYSKDPVHRQYFGEILKVYSK